MAASQDTTSRARLLHRLARNNSRQNNSTISSTGSHLSDGSVPESDFDPENEAIMSTRQFDQSPVLQPLRGKQFLRPEPAYSLDKEAIRRIIPASDEGSDLDGEDSIEIGRGRGERKRHHLVEDSRNEDESFRASGLRIDNPKSTYTPPVSDSKDTRRKSASRDLRKDAQLRLASMTSQKENVEPIGAAPLRFTKPQVEKRIRKTLGEMHTRATETYDGSLLADERPQTVTFTTKNTRFGSGTYGAKVPKGRDTKGDSRYAANAQDTGAEDNQSYLLPDLPNLSELVSGIYQDGTPVFPRAANKSRFGSFKNTKSGKPMGHLQLEAVPIPEDEKAIFVSLKLLQEKVADLEMAKAKAENEAEELREANAVSQRAQQEHRRYRRSDSALGTSDEDEGFGSGQQLRILEQANTSLQNKLNSANRKVAISELTITNLSKERDAATAQLAVAFMSVEEMKNENEGLQEENERLRAELAQISALVQRSSHFARPNTVDRLPGGRDKTVKCPQETAGGGLPNPSLSPAKERQDRVAAQVNDQLSRISEEQNNEALFSIAAQQIGERKTQAKRQWHSSRTTKTHDQPVATAATIKNIRPAQSEHARDETRMTIPDDVDKTYLSFINPDYIDRLRKSLEQDRITQKSSAQRRSRDDGHDGVNATTRSAKGHEEPHRGRSLPRKSSLKNTRKSISEAKKMDNAYSREATLTQKSNGHIGRDTDIEDTEELIYPGAARGPRTTEPTMTAASAVSNTSRRRQRPAFADENMTSAFILPDITMAGSQTRAGIFEGTGEENHSDSRHDGANCIVCQRILNEAQQSRAEASAGSAQNETVAIPRPIPVSDRMPPSTETNPDPTLRPSQPPSLALAIAIKTLEDELSHLKAELGKFQARYDSTDPSLSRRGRKVIGVRIRKLLKVCEQKGDLIYSLYDVLEGQKESGREMTQDEVEVTLMNLKEIVKRNDAVEDNDDISNDGEAGTDSSDDDLPEDEEWNGLPDSTHTNTQDIGIFGTGRRSAVA